MRTHGTRATFRIYQRVSAKFTTIWQITRALLVGLILLRATAKAAEAPHPTSNVDFHWAPALKEFLGTAVSSTASKVYFTGANGILTEVFYPSPDTPQIVDLQLLVVDAARTYSENQAEEKRQPHTVERVDPRAMLWQSTITSSSKQWQTVKQIYTDPERNSLIEDVTFRVLDPSKTVDDFNVYVLCKPAINMPGAMINSAPMNNSRTLPPPPAPAGTRTMLCASVANSTSSALAASIPWKTVNGQLMVSNGFFAFNDGWTDLFGDKSDRTMHDHFDAAYNGNVSQTGWLDFAGSKAREIKFTLVLSFGKSEAEAMATANGTLDHHAGLKAEYVNGWKNYANSLTPQTDAAAADEYYLAAMTLKSAADKTTGAMVAGLGSPWGESDDGPNGYHRVWARDLFKFASALSAAGDTDQANQAVSFLLNRQLQTGKSGPEGSFPRYSLADGTPLEGSIQLDEVALPIVLAWKLKRTDLWPRIELAANYLLNNGPATEDERWEEQPGYSPSTIAAEVAGLVCAADIAKAQTPPAAEDAQRYLRIADFWRGNLATWLVTSTGPFSTKGARYFIRVDNSEKLPPEDLNPNNNDTVGSANNMPSVDKRQMVDNGFLELPRLGVLSPDDWSIRESLPVTDQVIKQSVDGKYDGFFRYDYDGYGQHNEGSDWRKNHTDGRGRLWPILSAERGIYEVQRAKDGNAGRPYLDAIRRFTTAQGFIPEQVYGPPLTLHDPYLEVLLPPGAHPGDPTGSICPLSWAMGEYINLLLACESGSNDEPAVVRDRYRSDAPQVKVDFTVKAKATPGENLYLTGDTPLLCDQDETTGIRLSSSDHSKWTATISLPAKTTFNFHLFKKTEPKGPTVSGSAQQVTTPASGEMAESYSFP